VDTPKLLRCNNKTQNPGMKKVLPQINFMGGSALATSVTYAAQLTVGEETVLFLSGLLHAERLRRGTRTGRRALGGSVALSVGMIEAVLSCEVIDQSWLVAAADVGVRWVPVPARGDRGRGPLVPAVQSVLPRR
jgi:hypothetical protein